MEIPQTTLSYDSVTRTIEGSEAQHPANELLSRYEQLVGEQRFNWTEHLRLIRLLGSGGQGQVFLSERRGADDFTIPVAVKVFSPERYADARAYDEAMFNIARTAAKVAQIQHDNLLDVHNFVERNRIRLMQMEWVDGYDLCRLLTEEMLQRAEQRVSQRRWEYINNVIVTPGTEIPRLKPGIAISVIRQCLAGLAALHRNGIVHGDLKPANIMLKRTGHAKLIDIGSAVDLEELPRARGCTPKYAAPEVLEGRDISPRSDLCSLGYVLIEALSGVPMFSEIEKPRDLLAAKRSIISRLPEILPKEVAVNDLLINFCRRLVTADPMARFASAEEAELDKQGAAGFHRQLIKGDLASEYENEIRLWLEELE
ncbi:MAG: serine/threonine protein kinase [Pirellulales bacterium]|nr:serine/threonine protein kinase [Pirellulales bacterium]